MYTDKQSPDATLTHSDIRAKILDFCSKNTLSCVTELKGSAQISDAGYTADALSSLSPRTHAHKEAVNTKSVERVSLKDVNFEEEEEDVFIINLHFSLCQ